VYNPAASEDWNAKASEIALKVQQDVLRISIRNGQQKILSLQQSKAELHQLKLDLASDVQPP
jgi:frataxin-like iron-binding protein CyaY